MKRFISGQNSRLSLNTSINRSQDGLEPRQSKVSNEKSWFEIFNRCYLNCFRSLPGWISLRRNPKKILSRYIIQEGGLSDSTFEASRLETLGNHSFRQSGSQPPPPFTPLQSAIISGNVGSKKM